MDTTETAGQPESTTTTAVETRTWMQILHAAAAAIEEHGHTQKQFIASDGALCTISSISVGAFGEATNSKTGDVTAMKSHPNYDAYQDAVTHVADHLRSAHGETSVDNVGVVCMWNNHTGRTKEEVTSMLRSAAAT